MLSSNEIIDRMRIVNRCMKDSMDEKDPDASISKFIREIGTTLNGMAVCVYVLKENGDYHCSYCWKEDGKPLDERLLILPGNQMAPVWTEGFRKGKSAVIDGTDQMRSLYTGHPEAERVFSGVELLIMIPIILEKELYGFVAFVNPERRYLALENQMFEVDANYIGIMIRHKRNADYILESSTHDELTGVLSINAFWNQATPLIRNIGDGMETRRMSIVFMDIRHFKIINGSSGHATGNSLLKELARTIRFFADTDAVARSMADHFYFCIEDDKAEGIVQRIHDYMKNESEINCDVKAGIYCLDGTEISASLAAGRAKLANDRISDNRYQYFRRYDAQMEERLLRESYVASHLDEALEREWIKVYYHPIVNLLDGAVSSFEALARWQDPAYGMLSPADFIQPLEDSWLLYKLDLYMIEKVCRQLKEDRDAGKNLVPVSVNLSRHDMELPDLHEKINYLMDSNGLDHSLLEIEITESALVNNEQIIQDHIRRFHQGGYRVWLDDFGSGYSSLNAVQNFDFDVLKIDMQFLRRQNEKTPAILMDIVDMAKRTGMLVMSEGVETKKQYDFLRDIGCVMAQGFYFTKPLPLAECLQVMQEKGYSLETRQDHEFYESIGRTNVLQPDASLSNDAGTLTPAAIQVMEDGRLVSVYTNRAYRAILQTEDSTGGQRSSAHANAARIHECLERIHDIGESAVTEYMNDTAVWKAQYRMIAKDERRQAYITTLASPKYVFMPSVSGKESGLRPAEENNIWTAVMESESIGFYWKDAERRFLGTNRAFLALFRQDAGAFYGKRLDEVIDQPFVQELQKEERTVLDTGTCRRTIISMTVVGEQHYVMVSTAPVFQEGKIIGLAGHTMDITTVDEERKLLEQEILLDPLTGIMNRRGFDRVMAQLTENPSVTQAIIINADINKFKSFNDRYGHAVGDILLKTFARKAAAFAGDEGVVSRNGGDEFQFIFRNPAPGLTKRIEAFFNQEHEFRAAGLRYSYYISGGAARYPDMSRDVQELYDKADTALYHAKLDPHHHFAFYNELMKEESREGMGLSFEDLAAGEPASVLIYRYDETEEILYANANCLRLFGCEDMQEFNRLTGRSFRTLIHPDDLETTERDIYLQQARPGNDGYDFIIYRILTKDGTEKEVMDIGRRIHDPYYGDLFYVLLWDNKELLRMFRQPRYDTVQQLNKHTRNDYSIGELSDFLEHLPGGMHRCYLSNPGHLEWCSPSLIHMLGYEEEEFRDYVGSIYVKIMAKEDWGSFVELGRQLSVKPGVGSCFYHLIRKDGTRIPCIEVMQSALGADGIMYGYANVMDISSMIRNVPLPDFTKEKS